MESNKKKKMIFITARLPYPANSGRKNVMFHYCKILHEVYNYEITVISFLEAGDQIDLKPDFIHKVIELPKISGKRKMINLVRDTFILRKYPMQVSLFYDLDCQKVIDKVIQDLEPDILMADMVRTTEYGKTFSGYKIADLDDMISVRYERQLKMDMETINPYGAYLFSLPKKIQKILLFNKVKKFILKNEISLLKKYERSIAAIYDHTVFVADREAELLNRDLKFNRALAIPLGVDVEYFGQYYDKLTPRKHTIGFLGAMNVAHNEAGVIHFINDILPFIIKRIPETKFIVVGGGVTERLKALENKYVFFTGRVDDVRKAVGECEVFVCPLTFGSGIKTKNLEAMAMGVPVVTTSIGAENINAADGWDWIIADDDVDFAKQVVNIMEHSELRNKLVNNASKFVRNNFTWKVAEEKMKFIDQSALRK